MNYIWELAIKAARQGIDANELFFRKGDSFSAYMELSFENINETGVPKEVDINPYYRYYSIFKELFHPDMNDNPEIACRVVGTESLRFIISYIWHVTIHL